jgi:uroporphyrinogen-III synthase
MSSPPPTVWITRARPGAERTAERVEALGYAPVIAPVLEARPLPGVTLDLAGVGALAFTSAQGVSAFAALTPARALPVFTVGDATAGAARNAGFAEVVSAQGDVSALAGVIAARRPGGVVLHPSAAQPAGDLVGDLGSRGVSARGVVVYETVAREPVDVLPGWLELTAILVHSPRAAEVVAGFLQSHPLPNPCFLALSPAVAAPLEGVKDARISIAPFPNDASLLSLLSKGRQGREANRSES